MKMNNYLKVQPFNDQNDQNLAINQMDICQENDNKQDIELEEMFRTIVDDNNKEEDGMIKEILPKPSSPDMCSRGINTTVKNCEGYKHESNSEYLVGLGGGVEGQKCYLSISTKQKGIYDIDFQNKN